MAFGGIAPPDPFLPAPGRPAQPWSRWHNVSKVYMLASGASEFSSERRKALLLQSLEPGCRLQMVSKCLSRASTAESYTSGVAPVPFSYSFFSAA
ncbi:hypothetical protein HPB50_023983 [Hyalomma asiaticum]|uniref:Uncharacterized protein n=1 Tax=Hyalomma asiaticum TaxID=266040 RepID=A0ACB7S8Y0_HYAAI|nr:hypothetical protein HPB50_023983 [Hyalomma asiaticum]